MSRPARVAALAAALVASIHAGEATIVSIAGVGPSQREVVEGRAAGEAVLGEVHALFLDADRNLWVGAQRLLVRVDERGEAHPAAGPGTLSLGDGIGGDPVQAEFAPIAYLRGVAVGGGGSVYFSDAGLHSVRRLRPGGLVETVVPASAGYFGPRALAFDSAGNLYFPALGRWGEDSLRGMIVMLAPDGRIAPLELRNQDGSPTFLNQPEGLTVDADGRLYVTEYGGHRVLRIEDGVVTVLAGTGTAGFSGDGGLATRAELNGPSGVAVAANGSVYISDTLNNRIRVVSPGGTIQTLSWVTADGGTSTRLYAPAHIILDPATKALCVAEYYGRRVWKIEGGRIEPVAGDGQRVNWPEGAGDGGPAVRAVLAAPEGLAVCGGNVYVADTSNYRVRRIGPDGTIDSIAGNGRIDGSGGDGMVATEVPIGLPTAIACGADGSVYIADRGWARIWRVSPDGRIAAILGDGSLHHPEVSDPRGIAVDAAGNVYVAERQYSRLIRLTPGGRTEVLWSGRRGMDFPHAVALDPDGRIHLAVNGVEGRAFVYRIEEGGAAGVVFESDYVSGLAFAPDGTFYVATNERVGRLQESGGVVWIAGAGESAPLGDHGPASAAWLNGVSGIAAGEDGVYVTQLVFQRVRRIW